MMRIFFSISILSLFLLSGCIKDDIVLDTIEPEVRLNSTVDSLILGGEFLLTATYLNNVGQNEAATFEWESSDESIISVNQSGLINALELGEAIITVIVDVDGVAVSAEKLIVVGMNTVVNEVEEVFGNISPSSFYALDGDFTMIKDGTNIILSFTDSYIADSSLPGLYVYLTNNPATISGAMEISVVTTFQGEHQYVIPGDLELDAYSHILYFCKPFNVKVGDGLIEQ